eukprot:4121378-Heterocapsa_arctica.AAC.1
MDFVAIAPPTTTRQRKQMDKDLIKANQEVRTTEMDHIMDIMEIGDICKIFKTVEEFRANRE